VQFYYHAILREVFSHDDSLFGPVESPVLVPFFEGFMQSFRDKLFELNYDVNDNYQEYISSFFITSLNIRNTDFFSLYSYDINEFLNPELPILPLLSRTAVGITNLVEGVNNSMDDDMGNNTNANVVVDNSRTFDHCLLCNRLEH